MMSLICVHVFRYGMDVEWSETGDRYLLKLFRDYLFHQVTDIGSAWIDFAHVVSTLNKVHVLCKRTGTRSHL